MNFKKSSNNGFMFLDFSLMKANIAIAVSIKERHNYKSIKKPQFLGWGFND